LLPHDLDPFVCLSNHLACLSKPVIHSGFHRDAAAGVKTYTQRKPGTRLINQLFGPSNAKDVLEKLKQDTVCNPNYAGLTTSHIHVQNIILFCEYPPDGIPEILQFPISHIKYKEKADHQVSWDQKSQWPKQKRRGDVAEESDGEGVLEIHWGTSALSICSQGHPCGKRYAFAVLLFLNIAAFGVLLWINIAAFAELLLLNITAFAMLLVLDIVAFACREPVAQYCGFIESGERERETETERVVVSLYSVQVRQIISETERDWR